MTPAAHRFSASQHPPLAPIGVGTFGAVTYVTSAAPVDDGLIDSCGVDPKFICEQVYEVTDGNEVITRLADWLIGRPLTIVMILVLAWIATRIAGRYVKRLVTHLVAPDREATARRLQRVGIDDPTKLIGDNADPRRESRASSISAVVGSTLTVTIWVIAIIMIIGELGIELGPLVAGAGIAGIALGFGAQSLVKDFISGLFMLVEDQYGLGDVVDLGEAIGTVEEVTLRTTVLRGLDGTVWHVPNGEVRRVGNKSQLFSVAVVDVDVAYDTDLPHAKAVMLEAARALCIDEAWMADVLDEPQILGVEALAADGVTLRMIIKTTPGTQWAIQRATREAIKDAMDHAGIEIPFPQRTVWMRTESTAEPTTDSTID